MPTLIESLLFEIGIDTKKLGSDSKEAENHLKGVEDRSHKAVQELEERGKQSGAVFKSLKEEAGGFFSMVAGAYSAQKIAGMSKDIMLNAEAMGFMASNLGIATERLKTWQLAAEKNGGSTGSMNGLLNQAAMVSAAAKRGEDFAGSQEFFGLGGLREDLQSPEAYMMAISRIVKTQYGRGEQAGLYSANALNVPPDLIYLFKQGPDAIRQILREQEKYANVSDGWAKAAHETMNSFRNIEGSLTKVGSIMLEAVNPELKKMAEYAERAAEAMARQRADVKDNTLSAFHELGGIASGKAIGSKIVVTGGDMAGSLAGKSMNLGGFLGPVGAIATDWMFPKAVATDEEAKAAWMQQNGGGDLAAKQKHLAELEQQYGLPPGVLDALWAQESGRGKNMLSPAGAEGHFQFMPATRKAYGNFDPNDFDQSADGAARYMRDLLKQQNGDLDRALRWYNAGGNYQGSQAGAYSDQVRERMSSSGAGSSNKTDIQVNGPITIQTQSTDAAGIKKEFADSMGSYSNIAGMAETGTH